MFTTHFRNIKIILGSLLFLLYSPFSQSQSNYKWSVGFNYFFDNNKYGKSSYTSSQTMNGIWLKPTLGYTWDEKNSIYAGVNLLKIAGTEEIIDKTKLTLYYEYSNPKVIFKAGAFPKEETLSNYNNFFFSDSIRNFEPVMSGIFWQIGRGDTFFNLWLDWTSYANETRRERFYFGFSGKYTRGLMFADFQSYFHHNANTLPPTEGEGVRENMQVQSTAGIHYTNENSLELLAAAGILAGVERDRRYDDAVYKPIGLVGRLNAEFAGIGTNNTLYIGDHRMYMYPLFGSDLYAGNPFLRGKSYLRSEWYVHIIESPRVSAKLNCNLHFSEKNLMFQQMLTVTANIGNFLPEDIRAYKRMPWKRLFE